MTATQTPQGTSTGTKPTNAKTKPVKASEQEEPRASGPVTSSTGQALAHLATEAKNIAVNLKDHVYIDKAENVRDIKSYTEEDIGDMMAQIEGIGGLIHPITVAAIKPSEDTENKPLILVSGYRRSLALLALAEDSDYWKEYIKTVPAKQIDKAGSSTGATRFIQLLENVGRSDLNQMEIALAVDEALKDTASDFNQKDMARMLGRSEANISQLLRLLRLPKDVQVMVSSGNLPFSHARELISPSRNVSETRYQEVATKGAGMFIDDFVNYLDREFGEGDEASGEGGKGSSQKPPKMLRATEVQGKYAVFLKQQAEKADAVQKTYTAKDVALAKLDAMNTVLLNPDTSLAKDIAPYLEEVKQREAEEEKQSEAKKAEDKFFREQIKRIEKLLDAPIDLSKPDTRVTPAAAYSQVGQEIAALTAEQKAALGFKLDTEPNGLMKKIHDTHALVLKERADSRQKRDDAKAKKLADEKAAADQAGSTAGSTAAGPAGDAGPGNPNTVNQSTMPKEGMNAPPGESGTAAPAAAPAK